jgi:hypothetical protein
VRNNGLKKENLNSRRKEANLFENGGIKPWEEEKDFCTC